MSPERTERCCHSGGAGEQIEGYCHSGRAISRGCRRNVPKGTATVAVQANRSKGTATVAVRYREDAAGKAGWYREGIARTSGETNFSGVHKYSCAARGPSARPPASSSRTDAPKNFVQAGPRAPAHEIGANIHILEILKNLKIKN